VESEAIIAGLEAQKAYLESYITEVTENYDAIIAGLQTTNMESEVTITVLETQVAELQLYIAELTEYYDTIIEELQAALAGL